ncbi:MAG: hypothetical protein CUN55_11810 [Phototrophicales bacterium]|nr:MAG: hypothetical protein CUN55_11810 [Phototrophicales bacterium]
MQYQLFGRTVESTYSFPAIGYAILGLRLVMGWIFLQAGLEKLFEDNWTAEGYLKFAIHPDNPFRDFFADMAGNGLVDALNIYGQIAIGLALILGVAVRWTAFWGAIMMILYWLTAWQGGIGDFIPLEHGYIVDDHIVYAMLLFGLGAFGAGRVLGLDAVIEKTEFVQKQPLLKYLLG